MDSGLKNNKQTNHGIGRKQRCKEQGKRTGVEGMEGGPNLNSFITPAIKGNKNKYVKKEGSQHN